MEVRGKEDLKERAIKSLKQGLARLWRRRSVTITEYDPSYKVAYLGNVITGWAKGDGCAEKSLCTLWKNYSSSSKPDVQMKLTVTQSGLKAVTKQHGLTEYWSHRVTYCAAPPAFPKVFCWVYRHEGRKLKQELRCHAVLCRKESTAARMADQLSARLVQALSEFKRDKLSRQNARLSLANAVYDNPSLPRRKILLSTGSHNYRPPLERSKSAPKLMSIEESLEEDEEVELRKSFRRPRFNSSFGRVAEVQAKSSDFLRKSLKRSKFSSPDFTNKTIEESVILANDDNNNDQEDKVLDNPSGNDDTESNIGRKWIPGGVDFDEDDDLTTDNEDVCSRVGSISDDECQLDDLPLHFVVGSCKVEEDPLPTGYRETRVDELDGKIPGYQDPLDKDYRCQDLHREDRHSRLQEDVGGDQDDRLNEAAPNNPAYNTNSLVRDRKKLFEKLQKRNNDDDETRRHTDDVLQNLIVESAEKPVKSTLVQHRRRLFEPPYQDLHFQDHLEKTYLLELEEDSTPSLQSISSCSDTSSKADAGHRHFNNAKSHFDLDSLSEEDSDESGYVESVPQEGSDDKERDLPHHQLMKTCVLTTKTACLQV